MGQPPTNMKIDTRKIVDLKNKGLTVREIAEKLNIKSTNTIWYHLKKDNYKNISYSELREKNYQLERELLRYKKELSDVYKHISKFYGRN